RLVLDPVRGALAHPYYAVRDQIRYNPFLDFSNAEVFKASSVLDAEQGFCVGKAALLAACVRAAGIPARVGFADVRNHLTTPRLAETMGSDLFVYHGYADQIGRDTSELQSRFDLVCRLLLEKKKKYIMLYYLYYNLILLDT